MRPHRRIHPICLLFSRNNAVRHAGEQLPFAGVRVWAGVGGAGAFSRNARAGVESAFRRIGSCIAPAYGVAVTDGEPAVPLS